MMRLCRQRFGERGVRRGGRAASRRLGVAWGVLGLAVWIAGCTSTPLGAHDTDTIQREILIPRCATAGCHAADRSIVGLDLASPGLLARVVNVRGRGCPDE